MTAKTYALTSSLIFALVAALHLIRMVWQLNLAVEGWPVPQWISPVEFIVAGFLSYQGVRQFRRSQTGSRTAT
jgi:hypothetical protein